MSSPLRFSRVLATIYGVGLPIGETVRRWNRVEYWPAYLDDWLIGGFLLLGVWVTSPGRNIRGGRALLASAWGVASGLGYASFFGHLRIIDQPDVGPIPQLWLTIIIGVGWVGTIVAMLVTVFETPFVESA